MVSDADATRDGVLSHVTRCHLPMSFRMSCVGETSSANETHKNTIPSPSLGEGDSEKWFHFHLRARHRGTNFYAASK